MVTALAVFFAIAGVLAVVVGVHAWRLAARDAYIEIPRGESLENFQY